MHVFSKLKWFSRFFVCPILFFSLCKERESSFNYKPAAVIFFKNLGKEGWVGGQVFAILNFFLENFEKSPLFFSV
jgi:hypothetical protein